MNDTTNKQSEVIEEDDCETEELLSVAPGNKAGSHMPVPGPFRHQQAMAQEQGGAITPIALISMAVQQDASIEKLQQLMDLQERWERNEAKKAFDKAMADFKTDPPELFKNKHVEFKTNTGVTAYDHASLDHIANEISVKMAPHGLSFRWKTEQLDGGLIRVTCIIVHSMGHYEETPLQASPDQSGGKNNIQAIGSTVQYLQRYTLLAGSGLATKDMLDDDGRTGGGSGNKPEAGNNGIISEEQALAVHARLTDNNIPTERFKEWMAQTLKVHHIEAIPVKYLDVVNKRIDSAIRAQKNQQQ